MCNNSFHDILTEKSIYSIILVIEGHLQGYLQGDFQQSQIAKSVIYMCEIHFWYYFDN